jgi:hypothetical protein
MKINIKVFHPSPPCAKCKQVEKVAKKVAERYPEEVELVTFPVISDEARSYGIMLTPGVVINDRVFSSGKVISGLELENAVIKELEVG